MAADCSSALARLGRVSQQGFSLKACSCFLLLFARRLFQEVRQLMKLWGNCLVVFFVGLFFVCFFFLNIVAHYKYPFQLPRSLAAGLCIDDKSAPEWPLE